MFSTDGYYTGGAVISSGGSNWFIPIYKKPVPKRIIFNAPATIVYWEDGTKTIVKCSENETFIPEVGLAMAFIRKMYPNRSEFLRFLKNADYQEKE